MSDADKGDPLPAQAEYRDSWQRFAELLDHAMNRPGVQAIPEVYDVLILLSQAIVALAKDVDRATYNGGTLQGPEAP